MSEETQAPLTIESLKPGTAVQGKVTSLLLYGVLVDIGVEQVAILHRSEFTDTTFRNLEEVVQLEQEVEAFVLSVDKVNAHIALTMVKPPELPWDTIKNGETYVGKVIRIEKFGVFVDIGAERPGMVHVSELADGYIDSPEEVVSIDQEVEVRVIRLNRKKRQIDLSMRTPEEELEQIMEPEEELPTAMELALRRARAKSDDGGSSRRSKKKRRNNSQNDIISRTLRNMNND